MNTWGLMSFMDRAFFSASAQDPHPFRFKPAAAVVSARRAGTTAALDQMNKYFFHQQMPIATSRYWNMVHGNTPEEVRQDAEGLQTMRYLGRNMAWLLKLKEASEKQYIAPLSFITLRSAISLPIFRSRRIRQELMQKAQRLDSQISEVSAKLHEMEAAADDRARDVLDTMKRYSGNKELTREIAEAFVDKILVYDPEHIEIRWKFPDEVIKFIEG